MRTILLTQGYKALVDDEDYVRLIQKKWCVKICHKGYTKYAHRRGGSMHRDILGAKPGQIVDHVNGNGLDNRRANLRICTHAENMRNHRGSKGVDRFRGRWRARIQFDHSSKFLGLFDTKKEAAEAYHAASLQLFRSFVRLSEKKG